MSLLAELAGRRLAVEPPDLANARDAIAKLQGQARLAAASSIATIAWITGEESPTVGLKEGVEACIALVRTDSEMRGAEIAARVDDLDVSVSRRALRMVLTASLIAAVDGEPRAARIEVHATREGDAVEVRVETRAVQEGDPPFSGDERPFTWEDVEVLARVEGVAVRAAGAPPVFCSRFAPCAPEPARGGP